MGHNNGVMCSIEFLDPVSLVCLFFLFSSYTSSGLESVLRAWYPRLGGPKAGRVTLLRLRCPTRTAFCHFFMSK